MPKKMDQEPRQPTTEGGYLPATPVMAAAGEIRLPRINGSDCKFYLVHNPDQWKLYPTEDGGWELLPVLKRVNIRPGVAGVEARTGKQPPNAGKMVARMEEEGTWRHPNPSEYMVEVQSDRGPRYLMQWEKIKPYRDGTWEPVFDRAGYHEWLRALVASGQIEPPRDSVIAAMRRRLLKMIDRASRQPHLPMAVKDAEKGKAVLDGLDAAVAHFEAGP